MVEVDFEDALTYPVRGDSTLTLYAIGGAIPALVNVLWVVVVVASIVEQRLALLFVPLVLMQFAVGVGWLGYFVRVARATFDGATEPPSFGNWGELARDGLWGLVVVLAYQVPVLALAVGGYALVFGLVFNLEAMAATGVGAGTWGAMGALLLLVVTVAGLVGSLLVAYLLPVSLVAYADEGRVRAAFSPDTLRTVGFSVEYAVPWVLAASLYFVVYSFVSFLTALLVGYLLVPFLPLVYFYVGLAAVYMFARAYAEEMELAVSDPGTGGEAFGRPVGSGRTRSPEDV